MAKQKSARAQINDLEVDQRVDFPLERYDYIVNCKTRLQFGTEKVFTSRIDRAAGIVEIKRIN